MEIHIYYILNTQTKLYTNDDKSTIYKCEIIHNASKNMPKNKSIGHTYTNT
jgi:hypothetical protein